MLGRNFFLASFLIIGLFGYIYCRRSIHRPKDPYEPEITTQWVEGGEEYYLADSHLEENPLFKKFDKEFFYNHLLPQGEIAFRYEPDKTVSGRYLQQLVEELVQELYETSHKKRTFKSFSILKMCDFNFKAIAGILILEFKDYPFVLKLFMETPQTFVNPSSKGFEPCCFFIMGGGSVAIWLDLPELRT